MKIGPGPRPLHGSWVVPLGTPIQNYEIWYYIRLKTKLLAPLQKCHLFSNIEQMQPHGYTKSWHNTRYHDVV